jgi:hypothetical protein
MTAPSPYIPDIYKDPGSLPKVKKNLSSELTSYINEVVDTLTKNKYEVFYGEDIKPNIAGEILELQNNLDNCVKKSGDTISGSLHILKQPSAEMDAVNKTYVDSALKHKYTKNCDLNVNHFRIVNVQSPKDLTDAVNKNYVDERFEKLMVLENPVYHIFSKGEVKAKKTYFFNPGFICPKRIYITSVGFSTSPYKYKIGEKVKLGEVNPTKLYFMVNQEIKSEYTIEKDVQLGYILKEFSNPIVFEKGDNLMMVVESVLDDSSVNITFHH